MYKSPCRLHLLTNTQDAFEPLVQTLQQHNMQAFAMSKHLYFRGAFIHQQIVQLHTVAQSPVASLHIIHPCA